MKNICILAICLLLAVPLAGASSAYENRQWSFRVLLDGKEVGSQQFLITDDGGKIRLETKADFKVKFLFATVYRYTHTNIETWEDNCLTGIDSSTDANGKPYTVNGQKYDGYFEVTGDGDKEQLPECIMSFAYWNPAFLEHDRLLNTQNGEYLEVKVSEPELDFRTIRGEKVPALRYRLAAGELDLQLWYSTDNEWLALESRTAGNRILSYELL